MERRGHIVPCYTFTLGPSPLLIVMKRFRKNVQITVESGYANVRIRRNSLRQQHHFSDIFLCFFHQLPTAAVETQLMFTLCPQEGASFSTKRNLSQNESGFSFANAIGFYSEVVYFLDYLRLKCMLLQSCFRGLLFWLLGQEKMSEQFCMLYLLFLYFSTVIDR